MGNCFVYFIRLDTFIKIGISRDPRSRCVALSVATPYPCTLVAVRPCETGKEARQIEHEYHRKFYAHRAKGEWFHAVDVIEAEAAVWKKTFDDAVRGFVPEKLHKLSDVAEQAGVPLRKVQSHIEQGILHVQRIGPFRRPRVAESVLRKYLILLNGSCLRRKNLRDLRDQHVAQSAQP